MRVDSRAEGEGPRRVAEGKAFMPRAAQWDSRVRSTGTMLGVQLLVLVARHGPLVVLRRRPTQAETPKTVRGHVFKGHFEPDRLYGAIEVVGKRYVANIAQSRIVGTADSGTGGRDTAGAQRFSSLHIGENVAACTTAVASNTVAAPPKSATQRSWYTCPSAPSRAPNQSHRMASPVRRSLQVTWSQRTCPGGSLLFAVRKCPIRPHVHCEGPPWHPC